MMFGTTCLFSYAVFYMCFLGVLVSAMPASFGMCCKVEELI